MTSGRVALGTAPGTSTREGERWQDRGSCFGESFDTFFPPDERYQERVARTFCRSGCPVLDQCREHALTHPERYGVWGGLTEGQREQIWRQQRRRLRRGLAN